MSFSCPHYNYENELCKKIKDTCVPGKPGCVLYGKVTFASDFEKQTKNAEKSNQR
jgi:hypothetical protein